MFIMFSRVSERYVVELHIGKLTKLFSFSSSENDFLSIDLCLFKRMVVDLSG